MDVSIRERGTYRFGPFALDPVRRALLRDGARVKLAERLFDTLFYLVANNGRLVEREELLAAVWGGRTVEDNNIAQAIFTLRKVLQVPGVQETFIVTVPGRGYRFAAPVSFEPEPISDPAPDITTPDPAPEPPAAAPSPWWHGRLSLGVALLALLLAGTSLALFRLRPVPEDSAAFAPPAHSVAVLAFDNMSGDPSQDYFSDGLSEQLIDSLARVDALQVAARTSAFSFKGSHATIADIARKLNVASVLEGSVRRDGGRVRITAQLINALTGYHYWSKTYDRDRHDLLSLQRDIAQAVTDSLRVTLLGNDVAKLSLGGTGNDLAYDAYLRGLTQQRVAKNEAGYRAALAQFDTALAQDPDFALAHDARAKLLCLLGATSDTSDHAARRKLYTDALAGADRAIALAPALGSAHSTRGVVLRWGFLDHEGDEAEQAKARALTPGSAAIETNYANAEMALGHVDAAVAAARRAADLNPMIPGTWGSLADTLYSARRYPEALAAIGRARMVSDPLPDNNFVTFACIELALGHPEAVIKVKPQPNDYGGMEVVAIALHRLRRQAEADSLLARMRALVGDEGAYNYAIIYAQWGRIADALHWLQTAYELHDTGLIDIKVEPLLDPIRGTPQFQDIARRLDAPQPR